MVAFCDSFARKGYVTATIDYRQGVEVVDNGNLHYTRSAYRGVQDGRAAVRFLRANAETYGIDPDKIYWGSNSAGSFIGLNSIYMDSNEKPTHVGSVNYTDGMIPYSGPDLGGLDIGLNIAYLVNKPMTFYYLGYEPTSLNTIRNSFIKEYREIYKDSVWFLLRCLCLYLRRR